MINSSTARALEKYGQETICYTLNGKNSLADTDSLAITLANELVELDGGRELMRTKSKVLPKEFMLHDRQLKFAVIYATPKTKQIAKLAAKKYKAHLVMIY